MATADSRRSRWRCSRRNRPDEALRGRAGVGAPAAAEAVRQGRTRPRIQMGIEEQRLQIQTDSVKTELAAEQADVDRLETISRAPSGPGDRSAGDRRQRRGAAGGAARRGDERVAGHESRSGRRPVTAEGRAADRRDTGQGHPDRPAGLGGHAERRHSRPRDPDRPGGAERHRHGGCRARRGRCPWAPGRT